MKSKPLVMEHYQKIHTNYRVDFTFTNNITILTGDSGQGKTAVFSFFEEDASKNPLLLCFNYLDFQKNISEEIMCSVGKLIVIDNADLLLTDGLRKHISLDDKNQYLLIGRTPKNLFATRDNIFELVSKEKDGKIEFGIKPF